MDELEPPAGDLLDMKVETLLSRWPITAQVLIAHRMACIGCDFAQFHTTRQALDVYDLEIDPFLDQLQRSLAPSNKGGSA